MDWGLHFPAHIHSWQWVSHGEKQGFSYFMPYDSIGSDVYETLALCAANTKTIKLGPGVTSPRARMSPVTARAMATLNELAPGRCVLGLGTGNTARRAWGMPIAKLEELRNEVEFQRKMLKGEETLYSEGPNRYMDEERRRYVKLLSPDMAFINTKDEIPVFVAGSGPKTLELAGEIADGVMLLGAIGESYIDYCMEHIRIGAERAGRKSEDIYKVALTGFHILQNGETLESESLRQAVGPIVSVCFNIVALSLENHKNNTGTPRGEPLPDDVRDGIMKFTKAYPTDLDNPERKHLSYYSNYFFWNDEFNDVLNPEMIKASTLVGTPEEIIDTVRRMESQGVGQVMIAPLPDPVKAIDSFHENIMSRY